MRGVVKFLLTLILGVALIWLGFWWYAEGRLQSGFAEWAEKQAVHGMKISYASLHRGTSVLNAAVTIDNLTLTLPPGPTGIAPSISLPTLTLRIFALNPLVLHADLPGKISLDFGNFGTVFNSGSIALAETIDPNKLFGGQTGLFRGSDFSATDIDILASEGSLLVLHIDSIASHDELDPNAGAGGTAIEGQTAFDGVSVSPLLTRLASIPFGGRLTHIAISNRFSGPVPPGLAGAADQLGVFGNLRDQQKLIVPIIHQWAAAGGNGNIGLDAIIGPSSIHVSGSVKFDANLQPNGTADLTADHLDQTTAALINAYPSLQDDIAQLEARLSPYLSDTGPGGQTLTLHFVYGKPGVMINGEKAGDMPQFDWNAAENPLPPPIQAGGDGSGAAGSGAAGSGAAGSGAAVPAPATP